MLEESSLIFPTTFVRLELDIEFGSYDRHKKGDIELPSDTSNVSRDSTSIVPDKFVSGELSIEFGTFGRDKKDHNEIKDLEDDEKVSRELVEDMDSEIRREVQNYLTKVLKLDQENKSFSSYEEDIMETRSFGSCGDLAALHYLCSNKAGRFVGRWITDDEYRKTIDTWKTGSCVEERLKDDPNDKKITNETTSIPAVSTLQTQKKVSCSEEKHSDNKQITKTEESAGIIDNAEEEKVYEVSKEKEIERKEQAAEEARMQAEVQAQKEAKRVCKMASQLVSLDNVHDVLSVNDGANQSVEVVKKELEAQATNNTIIDKNSVDKQTKFVSNDLDNIALGSFGRFKDVCNEDSGDHTNIMMEESTLIFPTTFVRLELDVEFGSYNRHKKGDIEPPSDTSSVSKDSTSMVLDKFVSGELSIEFGTFGRDKKDHNEILKDLEDDEKVSCEVVEDMDSEIRLEVQNYLMKVLKLDQEVSLEKQVERFLGHITNEITSIPAVSTLQTQKKVSCSEEKHSDNKQIMKTEESAARSGIIDNAEEEKVYEVSKEKEIERKEQAAEEARMQAEVQAQKEAKKKEKARLKRLRKKEKKRAGVSNCNISDQDVVESNGSNELHKTNEEIPQRPSSHFLSKQLKYKTIVSPSTVKLALRKMVLAVTLVLALFILVSTN